MGLSFDIDENNLVFKYLEKLGNETKQFTLMDTLGNKYENCNVLQKCKIFKRKKGKRYIRTLKYNNLSLVIVCR